MREQPLERKVTYMKNKTEKFRRNRFIAAVCAATVLIGGSAGIYAFAANSSPKADSSSDNTSEAQAKKTDDGLISAGGTIETAQLSDELGLKDTSARLTVEKVLVSTGDSVKSGTQLYQLTSDSTAKAKSTLQTELSSANNALIKQKTSYQEDKIKAYSLYQSQLLQGKTAQQEYDTGISSLDSKLKSAYESYQQAQSTVNNAPSEISKKKSELSAKEKTAESLEEKNSTVREQAEKAEKEYTQAAQKYNSAATPYNSAASVVIYLGNALGKDVSGISLVQAVSVTTQGQKPSGGDGGSGGFPSRTQPDDKTYDSTKNRNDLEFPDSSEQPGQKPGEKPQEKPDDNTDVKPQPSDSTDVSALYENAYKQYCAQKKQLDQAKSELDKTEKQYKELSDSLSKSSSELSEAKSSVSSLEREISELESSLSKAKSNLTKLRSEYDSLNESYETDKLELKNKLDTDTASCENAKYNYDITIKTLDSKLEKAQSAYDTAAENVSIFEKDLAGGYICAKQDGTIDTLNLQEGKRVNVNSPFVTYVDQSELKTTVELDQYDVTQINIGDTVVIYSSETGVSSGRITAIAAGESKSLADVKFNVTVTADENSGLYSGQSVNVYFNFSGMNTNKLSDYSGDKKSDKDSSGSGRTRPDFGGDMPEGFDPSNIPDLGGRKEE